MRLSINDLEEAEKNPEEFVHNALTDDGSKRRFGKPGRGAMRSNAILNWHKATVTAAEARAQLEDKYSTFKTNSKKYLDGFDLYVSQYNAAQHKTTQVRRKASIAIPVGADPRFKINIQIQRFDRNPDGTFTAWILSDTMKDWKSRLRMPLLHAALASKYNLDLEEVDIAVYCFDGGTTEHFSFSQDQIDAANDKLKCLLSKLSPLLKDEEEILLPSPKQATQKVFQF